MFVLPEVKFLNSWNHSMPEVKRKNTFSNIPHVVIFFEESIVFNCPLLELHIYTAAVDADDAPDPTGRDGEMEIRI